MNALDLTPDGEDWRTYAIEIGRQLAAARAELAAIRAASTRGRRPWPQSQGEWNTWAIEARTARQAYRTWPLRSAAHKTNTSIGDHWRAGTTVDDTFSQLYSCLDRPDPIK